MTDRFNIGLLGFGFMGKTHAFCVDNLKYYYDGLPFDARIVGVCTTSMEKSLSVSEKYGLGKACVCEDDLIYDPEINVIDVCTPNIYHFETVKKALLAGKHVYCEKPLCVNAEEARELARLAREKGLFCGMVFNNRHIAPALKAKELVEQGRIGRVLSFDVKYLHNSCADLSRNAGWKQNKDICGGGVLFDLGSHAIDMVYNLCGEFESVYGVPQIAYPVRKGSDGSEWHTNADEAFYMICKLKSGAVGNITVSKLVNGANDDLTVEIYGEKGSLRFSVMQPNFLYFYDVTEQGGALGGDRGYKAIETVGRYPAPGGAFPAPKAPTDWIRGHAHSMYSFLRSVYDGREPSPDFEDGAHVQAVMEAAYASAKSGVCEKV